MNMKLTQNRTFKRMFVNILRIFVILTMALPTTIAVAASDSPFPGKWEAVDVDGSDIRLTIGGPPDGPFQITWTESYISFCNGESGIVRGTGWLNENNSSLLEADLHLECFTTDAELDFHLTWRYHPATNTLSSRYDNGAVTIWHRPGGGQAEEPPVLGLRINYGHDWVESFYEGGHTAWITVTDADGNVRATSELLTEPKDYWGGETGFQSMDSVWLDEYGNQMENLPDIQPYDWVYGWIDNGASAQVQIGDISGAINLNADSITGTVNAPWFENQPVEVECLPWGSPKPLDNVTYGMVAPDNAAEYSCSWSGAWNVLPYQDIGVGYLGPDGQWVANAFNTSVPSIVASESGDWFWTNGFVPGMLDIVLYASSEEGAEVLWSGQSEANQWGFAFVGNDVHGQDLAEGNYLIVSDGTYTKSIVLLPTAVTVFDTEQDFMAGVAPAGSEVWAAAGPQDWQQRIFVEADPDTGEWMADFAAIGFDITEEMRGWSYSSIYDDDGDVNEGSTPPYMATIIVTSADDVTANDDVCTLREAITAANTNAPSGDMDGECAAGLDNQTDTILLAADQTYSLKIDSICDDDQVCGDLDIWDNSAALDLIIMVEGNGSATISQDAVVDDRVLENYGATVQIDGLTLTGGNAPWSGGGINNGGDMELSRCTITGNNAPNGGGGGISSWGSLTLINSTVSNNTSANNDGGGITNSGQLTIDASVLSANSAPNGGGGGLANFLEGTAILQNGTVVSGNLAGGASGLFNYGTLTVADSTVAGNSGLYAGGIGNAGGQVTLSNTLVSDNTALASAGGIHNTEGGTITIDNGSVVSGNTATWDGGGINNWNGSVILNNSTVTNNSVTQSGGGILNLTEGTLTMDGSTISNNSAGNEGGGVSNWGGRVFLGDSIIDSNIATGGGGIFTSGGEVTLDASTVSNNTVSGGDGGIQIKDGATVTVQNGSVISGNSAPNGYGGGVVNWSSTLTINASSIIGNSAAVSAGGVLNKDGGLTTIENGSLIFGNTAQWDAGVSNWDSSTLVIDSSTVSYNEATGASGGIGNLGWMAINASIISGNAAPVGGGVFNNGGTLTITGSMIFSNTANYGGGILNVNAPLTVTNSALLGNTAAVQGGAFYNYADSFYDIRLTDSCVVGNSDTAFFNESTFALDATGNWWGDASGPSGFGSGSGDSISDHISFSGWLTEPTSICTLQ
jgi:CSLREA domain-containing protein